MSDMHVQEKKGYVALILFLIFFYLTVYGWSFKTGANISLLQ